MADGESRRRPSRREKGKAKVWEPIELSSDDDQTEKDVTKPIPSPQGGHFCLSKTLTSREVDPKNPVFYLDAYEAFVLTDRAEVLEPPSVSYSMSLPAFDNVNRVFNLMLSYVVNGDWAGYSVTEDWGEFVKTHNLKAGDKISFYRNLDRAVLDRPYYVLKYDRMSSHVKDDVYEVKESELAEVKVDASAPFVQKLVFEDVHDTAILRSPDRKRKLGPGSRVMPDGSICLSKTLTTPEVTRDDHPRLYLDASEASSFLTGYPEILDDYTLGTCLKNLVVVFDADDRQYDMRLTRSGKDDGETIYALDCGWQRFVRIHGLTAGDEISVYRVLDGRVHDEHYYVIKYTKKGSSDSDRRDGP